MDSISVISPEALTPRQLEVARLIERGKTNPQIAQELEITLDGAKYHVSELLVRLGVDRREDVAEWYRANFNARTRVKALLALPSLGALSPGAITVIAGGAAAAVLVVALVVSGQVRMLSAGDDGEYPPFVMEMRVTGLEIPTTFEVLDWNSYADWTYSVYDEQGGTLLGQTQTDPNLAAEGSRHIPSHWFRPMDNWQARQRTQVSEYVWEHTYTRDCTEISNWEQRHDRLPPTFCPTRDDTFEDRTVAEFDPDTEIPIRYTEYLDGIEVADRVAVSLELK